jgi:16S rRNA (uracil1498-N3)-methyltransferase
MELFYSRDISSGIVRLDQEESAHCVRVLRHRAGDEISVIDGEGTLYRCRLCLADAKGAEAQIIDATQNFGAHPYHLTMAVCPTKNIDRYEWFAEKATEIGIDALVPVIGEHSERKIIKPERLQRILLSAAKQSLKGRVPELGGAVSVMEFIRSAPQQALRLIAYCDESLDRESRRSIEDELSSCGNPEICILIGPEGDFSPAEVETALSLGWKPVTLGESRLRTETAAVVVAAAVYLNSPFTP